MSTNQLPDWVKQELRNLVATYCRNLVFTTQADGMRLEKQDALMQNAFHGNEAYASCLSQLLSGKEPFTNMYNKVAIENNRASNENHHAEGHMLEMREKCNRMKNSDRQQQSS